MESTEKTLAIAEQNTSNTRVNTVNAQEKHKVERKPRRLKTLEDKDKEQRMPVVLAATASPNSRIVSESSFPCNMPFVVSHANNEVFIKISKGVMHSLFSGQKYSTESVRGYLVNLR